MNTYLGSILPKKDTFAETALSKLIKASPKLEATDGWWCVNPGTHEVIPLFGCPIAKCIDKKKTIGVLYQLDSNDSVEVMGDAETMIPFCEEFTAKLKGEFTQADPIETKIDMSELVTQMQIAVCESDLKTIKKLAKSGFDFNSPYPSWDVPEDGDEPDHNSFLHTAAQVATPEVCAFMLAKGADPNYSPASVVEHPPLLEAAKLKRKDVFNKLLKATDKRFHAQAKQTLKRNPKTLAQSRFVNQAIFEFARQKTGAKKIEKIIPELERIDSLEYLFGQMLLTACFVDNHPVVDFLIERGADLNGVSKFLGKTPLMMSLTKDTAQRLITAGANMNKTDQLGGTALMWQYDPAVMLQLISNGAKCKVVDRQRNGVVARTANNLLQLKTLRRGDFSKLKNLDANYAKVLKKMIAGGSGVDGRLPEHGMSPLMVMAKLDLSKSANLLLKAGANINATDRKGLMAWQHASAKSTLKKKLKPDK